MWDPAIALEHPQTDLGAFCDSRDMKHLRLRPESEVKPQVFHIRPLPSRLVVAHIMAEGNMQIRRLKSFFSCVVRVDNPRFFDGPVFVPQIVTQSEGAELSAFRVWSDAELDLLDATTLEEIGEVALGFNTLPKGIDGGYVLPPSSRRLLIAQRDLFVAMSQPSTSRPDSSPQGNPSRAPSSDSPSDEPGDASATDSGGSVAARLATSKLVDSP